MKILFVTQHYYPENFVTTDIANFFASKGNEVFVLTGQPNYGFFSIPEGFKKPGIEKKGLITIIRVKNNPRTRKKWSLLLNYYSFYKNSRKWVSKNRIKFDVVFSICISPITSCSAANLYCKNNPNSFHVHYCTDLWPEAAVATGFVKKDSILYRFIRKMSINLYAKMDRILISSPSFKEYFTKELHLDKPFYFVPHPPLGCCLFPHQGISKKGYIEIVYCGNIGSIQLIDQFVLALTMIKTSSIIRFSIIGTGKEELAIRKLVDNKELNGLVHFYGIKKPEETLSYLNNCDAIFVGLKDTKSLVSSTIPSKLISAFSFSKPIICALIGDGKDLAKKAGGTIICNPNCESIAKGIDYFCSMTNSQRNQYGMMNRLFYENELTLEKTAGKLLKLLKTDG